MGVLALGVDGLTLPCASGRIPLPEREGKPEGDLIFSVLPALIGA